MNATQKSQNKKDPRGVAASRSQSGGTAGQGHHGVTRTKVKAGEKGSEGDRTSAPTRKVTLASGREPTFYIGGGNGVALVEGPLTELGWKRTTEKQNENYKFKWVECKNTINYNAFKEGEQLVNHIPNCNLLTNKMGLLTSLQAYERLNSGIKRRETKLKLYDFIPETYRLDDPKERETFLETFQENDIWICKPTGMNQGKGIYLVRDLEEFKTTLQERDEKLQNTRRPHRGNMGRVIQRYLSRPLLLDGRKFDIRAYMLIGSTVPYLVLYHKGYVRLSLVEYDVKVDDLTAHLTNQYIQKRDPNYKEDKESTAWSMDKFNEYINQHVAPVKGLEQDWVYNTLTTKMKQIILYCFHAVKNRLHCKIGYSDLYGLDFMVDEDMKVYLIEVNVNPSLATNCEALKEVIPDVVKETIYLSLECFEKTRKGQALMPLHSLNKFDILFNGCTKSPKSGAPHSAPTRSSGDPSHSGGSGPHQPRGSSHSPVRRQKSPGKEIQPHRTSTRSSQGFSDSKASSTKTSSTTSSVGASSNKGGMTPKSTPQPLATHHVLLSPGPLKPIKERREPTSEATVKPRDTHSIPTDSTTVANTQTTITELGEVRKSSSGERLGSGGKAPAKQEPGDKTVGSGPKLKVERMVLPKIPQPRTTRTTLRGTRPKTRSPDRGN